MNPTHFFGGLIPVLMAPVFAAEVPTVLALGAAAPDFSLPGTDGKTYGLADFHSARVLCVIFTCNHCPDAVAAATRMEAIYQDYKRKGVAFVAVNPNNPASLLPDELGYSPYNDSFEEMKLFAKDHGWTFPYLYDGEKQEFAMKCGAQATPHAFVFDTERKLRFAGRLDDMKRKHGPTKHSHLRDALNAVLDGKEAVEKTPRPVGCSTKWLFKQNHVAKDHESWSHRPVLLADLDAEVAVKLRKNGSGKFRLINFWSTACGPCIAEFPDLVETYRRFQNRPFELVTVSLDPIGSREKVLKFLIAKRAGIAKSTEETLAAEGRKTNNYIWVSENPDALAAAVDPEWTGALPYTVLVSPEGKIIWRHGDRIDPLEMRKELVKALGDR